jgi:hypothetical protein
MSFHPMIQANDRSGNLTTIWKPKVETLEAAEPLIRRGIIEARLAGSTGLRIEIYDDLACRLAFRARVK